MGMCFKQCHLAALARGTFHLLTRGHNCHVVLKVPQLSDGAPAFQAQLSVAPGRAGKTQMGHCWYSAELGGLMSESVSHLPMHCLWSLNFAQILLPLLQLHYITSHFFNCEPAIPSKIFVSLGSLWSNSPNSAVPGLCEVQKKQHRLFQAHPCLQTPPFPPLPPFCRFQAVCPRLQGSGFSFCVKFPVHVVKNYIDAISCSCNCRRKQEPDSEVVFKVCLWTSQVSSMEKTNNGR